MLKVWYNEVGIIGYFLIIFIREVRNMQENMTRSGTPEGMRENYKKATVEMLILHLLSESPMYVYQLIQSFENRSKGLYKVATLYPAIYRLMKFGYIEEFEKKISEDNRLRRYYSITHAGKAYLVSLKEDFSELNKGISLIIKG